MSSTPLAASFTRRKELGFLLVAQIALVSYVLATKYLSDELNITET